MGDELIGVFVVQSYLEAEQFNEEDVQILEFVSDHFALAIARKKDQDKILENQDRQRQIIESSPDGLIVTNREGIILDHNSRIKVLLNIKRKNLLNRNLLDFVCTPYQMKLPEIFEDTLLKGFRKQEEIKMLRDDGTEFIAEISLGLIKKANGKPETYVITIKNIDERIAYETNLRIAKEKAEESDRLKTAFLSNMSHEIRTPMNAIIGFSELLSHARISEDEKKEFISQINYGAESLMRLIDDIIDIAKIEAGQLKIYESYFNLAVVLRDLNVMFSKNLFRQNKQHLKLIEDNNDNNDEVQLFGDQIRIRQILINLISNAIKFTESGEIRFGIKTIKDEFVSFYVRDSGIGIAPEKLNIIFDRFRQGHESKTKFYGGTGLGLAISKHLVELMGGSINVFSEKGKGSEFTFSIPFHTLEEKVKEAVIISVKKDYNWEGKIILIAEDETSNFILLKEILKNTKITILWAKDGKEVVEMFKSNPNIDLILMDVQLPFRNGYDAARIIKSQRKDIPVIAQTAYAMAGEKQNSLDAGCEDYIAKPIQIPELFSKISKYLTH
jgi:PAS domain S-box-containing protein